jgi:hypothetical protein
LQTSLAGRSVNPMPSAGTPRRVPEIKANIIKNDEEN